MQLMASAVIKREHVQTLLALTSCGIVVKHAVQSTANCTANPQQKHTHYKFLKQATSCCLVKNCRTTDPKQIETQNSNFNKK